MFGKTVHQLLKARLFRSLFAALLMAGLALPALPAFAATQTIVPYAAEGYKYQQIGYNDPLPAGFETPGFDDSTWAIGTAGFGVSGGPNTACPNTVLPSGTPWTVSTQMLVRKTFSLPARATNVQVGIAIDNDVRVWVNGHDVSNGLQRHEWCATRDSFVFTVTDAYINRGGNNVLAVQGVDRGLLAYLDIQVTSDLLPYNFSGFQAPIDTGAVNLVRAGAAVPVKFSLIGDQGLDIFAANSPASVQVGCDSGEAVNAVEETVTAGGSSLSYDALADQYTYVWKTDKAWAGTCRQLSVTLNDNTVHKADFQFK